MDPTDFNHINKDEIDELKRPYHFYHKFTHHYKWKYRKLK